MSDQLVADLQKISDEGKRDWKIVCGRDSVAYTVVRVQGCSVLFNWQRYANDCKDSELDVRIYAASFETPAEQRAGKHDVRFGEKECPSFSRSFKVGRHPALGVVWKNGGKILTPEDVSGETLTHVIEVMTSRR